MISQPAAVVFLKECQMILNEAESKQVALESFVNSHPCGKLYLRYGLIASDYSEVLDKANTFILKCDGNENIVTELVKILRATRSCNGSWIIHYESHAYDSNREVYEFESSGKTDAAFLYARFIYELGLLKLDPEQWVPNDRGFYSLEFSDLGKSVILLLCQGTIAPKTPSTKSLEGAQPTTLIQVGKLEVHHHYDEHVEDNSAKAYGGLTATAKGGKETKNE